MESLKKRHKHLLNTLDTVKDDIARYNKYVNNSDLNETVRRSLIQCFEYSVELTWRFLKNYMIEINGLRAPESPKETISSAIGSGILTEDEADLINEALIERNKTSHIYNQEISEIIAANIPKYHMVMEAVANRLGKELSEMA